MLLLVFSLYELVLGREAGETEAGGAELSHTDMQFQAVAMEMDLHLRCSTVVTAFTSQGCFCQVLWCQTRIILHFPPVSYRNILSGTTRQKSLTDKDDQELMFH